MKPKYKAIYNNEYKIYCSDVSILIELLQDDNIINWYNFNENSMFYSNDGIPYIVKDICYETRELTLEKY